MATTVLRTQSGRLDAADRQALSGLIARLTARPQKVLLHLHGGLVDQAHGEAIATRLAGKGLDAFNAPDDWEQVYVVWRTGAFETIRARWLDLATRDRLYRALLRRLLGFLAGKLVLDDAGRSVGSALNLSPAEVAKRLAGDAPSPFGDVDERLADAQDRARDAVAPTDEVFLRAELGAVLEGDPEFRGAVDDIAAALAARVPDGDARSGASAGDAAAGVAILERLDAEPRANLAAAPAEAATRALPTGAMVLQSLVRHGVAIGLRVLQRYRRRRDHGFHATVVEELVRELWGDVIGAAVWGAMNDHAAAHFTGDGLGRDLVSALASRPDHQILVTGHSAGGIWASEFLRAAAALPEPPTVDLALLAPAVRIQHFSEMLETAAPLIGEFRLFAMKDGLERADAVLGPGTAAVYPSSLLYLVSGLFEADDAASDVDAPILGMQRYLLGDAPPDWISEGPERAANAAVRAFIAAKAGSAWFSRDNGGAGRWTEATSHGTFDSEQRTLESVATLFA
jgi:hypothetical protein